MVWLCKIKSKNNNGMMCWNPMEKSSLSNVTLVRIYFYVRSYYQSKAWLCKDLNCNAETNIHTEVACMVQVCAWKWLLSYGIITGWVQGCSLHLVLPCSTLGALHSFGLKSCSSSLCSAVTWSATSSGWAYWSIRCSSSIAMYPTMSPLSSYNSRKW